MWKRLVFPEFLDEPVSLEQITRQNQLMAQIEVDRVIGVALGGKKL